MLYMYVPWPLVGGGGGGLGHFISARVNIKSLYLMNNTNLNLTILCSTRDCRSVALLDTKVLLVALTNTCYSSLTAE